MLFKVSLLGAVVHGADVGTYGVKYPYTSIPAAPAPCANSRQHAAAVAGR